MAALQRGEVLASRSPEVTPRVAYAGDRPPVSLTTSRAQQDRPSFLRESLGDEAGAQDAFENVLITNNHVLPDASIGAVSQAQFNYELDLADAPMEVASFALLPDRLFHTSVSLDFTVVAVASTSIERRGALGMFGFLPLLDVTGKAFEGEWLTIVQHPNGERKQVCVRENKLLERTDDFLRYSTDTEPGSSGSPVFNNDWYVVALHHRGVMETKNGRTQTIDGRDYDPLTMSADRIRWIANQGVRASRIAQTLKRELPTHPLLQPLFQATPAGARIRGVPAGAASAKLSPSYTETSSMSTPTPMSAPAEDSLSVRPDPLLADVRKRRNPPPYIIYGSSSNAAFKRDAKARGAFDETNSRDGLFDLITEALKAHGRR